MIANIENIFTIVEDLKKDYDKLVNKNNKAAGKRVRAHLLSIDKLVTAARKDTSEQVKAIGKKR